MNLLFSRNLRALVLVLTLFFLQSPGSASELPVSEGCDAPSHSNAGRLFYIDPVRGSTQNDGSAERPWRTLAEVVSPSSHLISSRAYLDYLKGPKELQPINPDGPVKPGDTLVLMSGDHGAVDLIKYENKDFINVVAGTNQTPTIRSMRVLSSSHWLFKGLKFQGANTVKGTLGALVEVSDTPPYGPGDNIIFVSDSFSTQDDVSDWIDADWVSKPYVYAFKNRSRCTMLFESHLYNIRNTVMLAGENGVVTDNVLENFGNDGIDVMASNLTIRHNVIKGGHHTPAEPMHPDGIQGWSLNGATNKNVLIDANTVIDTNQSDNNYMQGITIFDGTWDGLVLSNNVVLTNHWHGIALFGVENVVVINNTVMPSRPNKYMTWITVHPAKNNRSSKNVVVRNNVAGQIVVGAVNLKADHNIVLKNMSEIPRGRSADDGPGVTVSFNQENVPVDTLFRNFDMSAQAYDFHLAPKSPAIGFGSEDLAPAVDIEGRSRKPPIDVGAYAR